MIHEDYNYYAMRVRQEDEAASGALCAVARERHEELANAYRLRCELIRAELPDDGWSSTVTDRPKARQPMLEGDTALRADKPAAGTGAFYRL